MKEKPRMKNILPRGKIIANDLNLKREYELFFK